MLEQLTYVQIGDRLNISSEGARAIVKRTSYGRTPTHGYKPTREDAMAAFAKSWRRES